MQYLEMASPKTREAIAKCEVLQMRLDAEELEREEQTWQLFIEKMEQQRKVVQPIKSKLAAIPDFWYKVLYNAKIFEWYPTSPDDVKVLHYLKDITCHSFRSTVIPLDQASTKKVLQTTYTVSFIFEPNPYLVENVLSKRVTSIAQEEDNPPVIEKFVVSGRTTNAPVRR